MFQVIFSLALIITAFAFSCPSTVTDELQLVTLSPQCFRKLYDSQKHDGHKLSRIVNQRIKNYKRLLQDIKMNDVEHLKTHPVIKWAQSQSQIFLNLRLSHRHDSPTCSDIRFQQIASDVQETSGDLPITKLQTNPQSSASRLEFLSQCYFTHQKLLFGLNLQFKSTLTSLSVKKEGFGRYTIVGQKALNEIWINPFTDWKEAGIWSDMRNKHSKDMDRYFELLDEDKSNNQGKTKRKFKNKKAQRQFETAGMDL